jgi:rod shape-determining protein MreD
VKTQLKLFAIGVIFVLVQGLVMNLTERRFYPDLVLIYALALGLRSGRVGSLALAFGFGVLIDVLSSSPTGLYALLRGTACAATHFFDRALYLRASAPWAMYVLGYVVLDSLLLGAVTRMLTPEVSPGWLDLLWPVPVVAVLTAAVSGPLYPVFERLEAGSGYDSGWSTIRARGRG